MVLVWLDNVEVGSFTLGESVLSVKLQLGGDNRVLSPAMHVKSGLSKNECSSIRDTCDFVISNTDINKCPKERIPEYAFIGRSNVGKSSLINMLTGRKSLAKTSGKPGKTQLINHFEVQSVMRAQQFFLHTEMFSTKCSVLMLQNFLQIFSLYLCLRQ